MSRYIPEAVRQLVANRANHRCEYCLLPQRVAGFQFEIDHVISLKHGGSSDPENLAWSCPLCNGNKGSDLGTLLDVHSNQLIRFFNPRTDVWNEHFRLEDSGFIVGLTPIGRTTADVLGMNSGSRVQIRLRIAQLGAKDV